MMDKYSPPYAEHLSDKPTARLRVVIDGRNKTVEFKPLVEDYLPGNLQKIISEVKRMTQHLQG